MEGTPSQKGKGPRLVNQSIEKFLNRTKREKNSENPVGKNTYEGENIYGWRGVLYNSDTNDKPEKSVPETQSVSEYIVSGEQGRLLTELNIQQQHGVISNAGRDTELRSLGYNNRCTDSSDSDRELLVGTEMQRSAGPDQQKVNHQQ